MKPKFAGVSKIVPTPKLGNRITRPVPKINTNLKNGSGPMSIDSPSPIQPKQFSEASTNTEQLPEKLFNPLPRGEQISSVQRFKKTLVGAMSDPFMNNLPSLQKTITQNADILNTLDTWSLGSKIPRTHILAFLGGKAGAYLGKWAGGGVKKGKKEKSFVHSIGFENEGEFLGGLLGTSIGAHIPI